jgi:hypothetical protein
MTTNAARSKSLYRRVFPCAIRVPHNSCKQGQSRSKCPFTAITRVQIPSESAARHVRRESHGIRSCYRGASRAGIRNQRSEIGRFRLTRPKMISKADQKRTETGNAGELMLQTKGLIVASPGSAKPLCVGSIPTRASILSIPTSKSSTWIMRLSAGFEGPGLKSTLEK